MTVRKRRKKNKLCGQRTHGQGDTKNRRGAGSRGGTGRAGSHKHKYTKYFGQFGKEKKKVIGKARQRALNLDQIQQLLPQWVVKKTAEQNGKEFVVDGKKAGFSKIVARGKLSSKIVFENVIASKKALEKLSESGSEVKGAEEKESVTAKEEEARQEEEAGE